MHFEIQKHKRGNKIAALHAKQKLITKYITVDIKNKWEKKMKQTWGRFFSPLIGVNLNHAQLRTGSVSAMMIATVYAILKLIIKYASIKKCFFFASLFNLQNMLYASLFFKSIDLC